MRNLISTDSNVNAEAFTVESGKNSEVSRGKSEVGAVVRVCALALAGFLVIYAFFFALNSTFPYLRPGDDLVAHMKHRMAHSGNAFQSPHGERLHVMAFGYSKTMAGFVPSFFDSQMAAAGFPVESYNFGLPGDSRFVDDLEAMARRGTAPDIALLTFPWPAQADAGPTFFHFINDDQQIMEDLFPFRHLPRNFFIAATLGHSPGGIRRVYQESERAVKQVATDRGYYFIARQSHFKNDELPADLSISSDTPNVVSPRVVTLGPIYQQLAKVLADHKIQCLFVPLYFRQGEFAPAAAINAATTSLIAQQPNVGIIGPDYWLYPNRCFSDPVHANRTGAAVYTRDMAALVAGWLKLHMNIAR